MNDPRVQDESQGDITIFMGVPTMYSYLLSAYDEMTPTEQGRARYKATVLPSIFWFAGLVQSTQNRGSA